MLIGLIHAIKDCIMIILCYYLIFLQEGYGMGKGKPFCANKIPKKRLGLGLGFGPGRPGKLGKLMSGITSSLMMKKQQRLNDFGRKRMPKAKMRGIFGVPGLGLQVSFVYPDRIGI